MKPMLFLAARFQFPYEKTGCAGVCVVVFTQAERVLETVPSGRYVEFKAAAVAKYAGPALNATAVPAGAPFDGAAPATNETAPEKFLCGGPPLFSSNVSSNEYDSIVGQALAG